MKPDIPEPLTDELRKFAAIHTGLHFPPAKNRALKKGVQTTAREIGYEDTFAFVEDLLNGSPTRQMIDQLIKNLTIGETFFFRDKHLFQILRDDIFRGILQHPQRTDKRLRIWSAGCATGEEPYSIAILIEQMQHQFRGWDITIIGSDINPYSLARAESGSYTQWSFRDTPDAILKKFFIPKENNSYEITPRIKQMVRFKRLNFVTEDYLKHLDQTDPMDIILCRNVLMYFDGTLRDAVISRLNRSLAENGWFIAGPAETGFVNEPGLTPVRFPNAILHRKGPPRKNNCPADRNQSAEISEALPSSTALRPLKRRKTDEKHYQPPTLDLYQEALTAYQKGRYRTTIRTLSPVLHNSKIDGNSFLMLTESMALMARAHANLGELEEAVRWCRTAIAHEKLNALNYYLLATIHQEGGQYPEAVSAAKQALYLDPEFIMGHFTLGLLMQQTGRATDAGKYLKNALSLLKTMAHDDPVPNSDGITAGRLQQTVELMMGHEN